MVTEGSEGQETQQDQACQDDRRKYGDIGGEAAR